MSCFAVLAVPGDLMTLTGGYLYDRRLLQALRALGRSVAHIELPGSFPDPSPEDQAVTRARLAAAPPDCPIIIDGLALGTMDPNNVAALDAPVVALIHHPLAEESGLPDVRRNALFQSERDNLAAVRHVIVTSPHTARLLTSRYGVESGRITIARPGVDQPQDEASPADPPADPPLILSVGIAVPRKGHDVLLRALALMTNQSWDAVIVGEARNQDYAMGLEKLVSELGLTSRVRLAGRVPAEELARYYKSATVFALATRYEGHGIVFDEAMTYGLPVVSCAVGAVPDTVAQGAGLLVPAEDPDAFAAALRNMLVNEVERSAMAELSKQAGQRLPRWDQTVHAVANVIEEVAASG